MPRLIDLLERAGVDAAVEGLAGCEITALAQDSRQVIPGTLFFAISGTKIDGSQYIRDAVARGASAVLMQQGQQFDYSSAAIIKVEKPRLAMAKIAAAFYSEQPQHCVAITGTNGKTSTAEFYRQLWQCAGGVAASIGTLGLKSDGRENEWGFPAGLTSPEPILLHNMLQQLAQHGVDYVAIEASSHGLDQHRIDGVKLEAAAFTNLTHDHLDYHHDMEHYFAAKARLFTELNLQNNMAVINVDDNYGERLAGMCIERGIDVFSYGKKGRSIVLREVSPVAQGLQIEWEINGVTHPVIAPVYGAFQAQNLCAAVGLAMASGMNAAQAVSHIPKLTGVRGRMECVALHPNGAPIFVDYAHTPHALLNVLQSVRAHTKGRIHLVFGCGGDRDAAKRPLMGNIAAQYADSVIVTDDNPRSEDAAKIRAVIMAKTPGANEIGDRNDAIVAAVQQLQKEDALIVAGKGHETYQIIGGTTYYFDDAEKIKEAIKTL